MLLVKMQLYSQPVTVDLRDMFVGLDPITSREMTLTANLPIDELQRLKWKTSSNNAKHEVSSASKPKSFNGNVFSVTLNPMDIRTFLVRFIPTGSQQVF